MTGGIDSVLFDKVRQPSFGLRARNLVDGTDDHRTSDSFVLARYIEAIAADVLRDKHDRSTRYPPSSASRHAVAEDSSR
jgi:hypothetical protein